MNKITTLLFIWLLFPSTGQDWPMWRHDKGRTAVTKQKLADELHLQWTRQYPPLQHAWEDIVNQDRMGYDRMYEPIVLGKTMFVGSNRSDKVVAIDTITGKEKWSFYTNGPVRFAPVGWKGKVYFVSDDGFLYCVKAQNGKLLWKFRGGADNRKTLGNSRLISAWPARGGPVIEDGIIYFGASIWPFMGVFIHAVDAKTGDVVWTNDGVGPTYTNQPHGGSVAFGSIAPQGAFTIVNDKLLVPGGRTAPACFDKKTGKMLYYHLEGSGKFQGVAGVDRKREGGSDVYGIDKYFFNHRGINTTIYDLDSGLAYFMWNKTTYPVLDGEKLYLSGNPVEAYSLKDFKKTSYEKDEKDKKTGETKKVTKYKWDLPKLWQVKIDGTGAMVKTADKIYVGGKNKISALKISENGKPKLVWTATVKGNVARIIAANNRLFAVTLEGQIYAFGKKNVKPKNYTYQTKKFNIKPKAIKLAKKLTDQTGINKGYCLMFGIKDGQLARAVATNSDFNVIVVDPNPKKVEKFRRKLDAEGLYGQKISVHVGNPVSFQAPSYLAAVIICQDTKLAKKYKDEIYSEKIKQSLRPYGGTAYFFNKQGDISTIKRQGALEGASNWTGLYGGMANTAKSDDKLVKLPLGILWFGGNTHADILPRHAHGPSEQVVDGRLFIEGINMLSARDVYTGKVLWKRKFEDLGTFDIYYDSSYKDNPLDTTYNQVHIPGANSRGTNYIVTKDKIYLAAKEKCIVLSPITGETIGEITLPAKDGQTGEWAYIGIQEDMLVAGVNYKDLSEELGVKKNKQFDMSTSKEIMVFDRNNGNLLWNRKSENSFRNNTIVADKNKLFIIDALPIKYIEKLQRRGQTPKSKPELIAVDIKTGKEIWSTNEKVFGTWLGYSKEYDLLLQSGRNSRDSLGDEPSNRISVFRGSDGEMVWDKPIKHSGPCMIHGQTVYFNAHSNEGWAINLLTGNLKEYENPLTGKTMEWRYKRYYGCNNVIASENLLSFRSGAAGFYDLQYNDGTGNYGGFKSGCTSNLIAADGVLNAPDYTRTCTCSYQNQTSVAMIHMPDIDKWTFNNFKVNDRIKNLGINFGAPGDRMAENKVLWLEYPFVGGPSPDVEIKVEPKTIMWYRRHSLTVKQGNLKWVAASGGEGIQKIQIKLNDPITTTISQISSGSDDAEEKAGKKTYLNSSDLEMTDDNGKQIIGLRFNNINLNRGEKFKNAYLQFEVKDASNIETNLTISAQATDNAETFKSEVNNITSREKTTAAVNWNVPTWNKKDQASKDQQSPDISDIIQEVIDRKDWKKGNSIVLLINGKGKRIAKSFDNYRDSAAKLIITPENAEVADKSIYTVKLYFYEQEKIKNGQRIFDVSLQGKKVLENFDIKKHCAKKNRTLIKEFKSVAVNKNLTIELKACKKSKKKPIISGIEIISEN